MTTPCPCLATPLQACPAWSPSLPQPRSSSQAQTVISPLGSPRSTLKQGTLCAAQSARCLKVPSSTITLHTTVTALNSSLSRILPRTVHLTRLSRVWTPSHTQPLHFTSSPPTLMVCPISSEYAPRLALKTTNTDPIIPAVRGTTSILNSALRYGNALKRVILTSSVAADHKDTTVPRVFTESNRNHSAAKAVKTRDSATGPVTIHLASKTLAEKVAWKFVAAYGSQMLWDLVVLNSPCIFGVCFRLPSFLSNLKFLYSQPSLSPAPTVDDINTSHRDTYDVLSGARVDAQLRSRGNWVHVAVAAEAHVRATQSASAGGQRIIVKSGPLLYQDLRKFYTPFLSFCSEI